MTDRLTYLLDQLRLRVPLWPASGYEENTEVDGHDSMIYRTWNVGWELQMVYRYVLPWNSTSTRQKFEAFPIERQISFNPERSLTAMCLASLTPCLSFISSFPRQCLLSRPWASRRLHCHRHQPLALVARGRDEF